jgi:hypothetical protein
MTTSYRRLSPKLQAAEYYRILRYLRYRTQEDESSRFSTRFKSCFLSSMRQGPEAAAKFQKIPDHSGIVWNCWTGALAHLGVARANALRRELHKERMQMPPASVLSPLTKISSPSGKTPTPTSPS